MIRRLTLFEAALLAATTIALSFPPSTAPEPLRVGGGSGALVVFRATR